MKGSCVDTFAFPVDGCFKLVLLVGGCSYPEPLPVSEYPASGPDDGKWSPLISAEPGGLVSTHPGADVTGKPRLWLVFSSDSVHSSSTCSGPRPHPFPVAALTNYHKLGGLRNNPQIRSVPVQDEGTVKPRCQQTGSFRGLQGRACPWPFPAWRGTFTWAPGPSNTFKAHGST